MIVASYLKSVSSYLVRPSGLMNLLPPCVHGETDQIVGADPEQLLRLHASSVLAETENGIKYNLQFNFQYITSCPHLMMAYSTVSDVMNWKAICSLSLGLASFRSMAGNPVNPVSFQLDCGYWDGGLELDNKVLSEIEIGIDIEEEIE